MKSLRTLMLAPLLAALLTPTLSFAAAEDEAPGLGHALTLMQVFVRLAAQSDNPADGRGAAEIARANGNARLAESLSRSLRAAR
jgi:hypothetical protein